MRRVLLVVAVLASFVLGGVAVKAFIGTPEIDKASATIDLHSQTPLRQTSCVGEDTIKYMTLKGAWTGTESEIFPGTTDYPLSGTVMLSGVVWTINLSTGRGVLTATITLMSSTGAPVFKGPFTAITEGVPAPGGSAVPGRGWFAASVTMPDETVTAGDDKVLANFEIMISPDTLSAGIIFGDVSGGTPDWSVVTNVAPALDGTC